MKNKFFASLILMFGFINAHAAEKPDRDKSKRDSIIVTFGDKTRLIIYGENRKELDKILKYDLNTLLKDVKAKLDTSAPGDTTFLKEEVNGRDYLKDKSGDSDYVRIGLRGIHVRDGETEVTINQNGVEVRDDTDSTNTYKRIGKRFHSSRSGSSPRKGFNVALGLNTYGMNKPGALYNKDSYDLKPFDSRYVSLGYIVSAPVARGKNAGLHFDFGADFSWYNLTFDGNNTVTKSSDRVDFPLVKENGQEMELKKSKLVVPNVNLSFMPTVSFKKSFISYISAGVYGGYRLGSYTKVRKEGSKDKEHVRMGYHINDFRYGFSAELGIRKFPDLFVNYDLNTLFVENKGPQVKMLSFGIRLF